MTCSETKAQNVRICCNRTRDSSLLHHRYPLARGVACYTLSIFCSQTKIDITSDLCGLDQSAVKRMFFSWQTLSTNRTVKSACVHFFVKSIVWER
jgi:hypothetical protein